MRPKKAKTRKFVVWAEVRRVEETVELPASALDLECDAACEDVLDTLIGNGDTGWNEVLEDGTEQ
jgi:hypothetical protein